MAIYIYILLHGKMKITEAYCQPLGTDVAMPYDTFSCNSQYCDEKATEMFVSTYDWSCVCNTHLWKLLPAPTVPLC